MLENLKNKTIAIIGYQTLTAKLILKNIITITPYLNILAI